ncbi:MAG: hypothetical protein ABIP06_09290 [Pyrinomonadaceae bacterium]
MKNIFTNCSVLLILICVGVGCKTLGRLGKTDYFAGDSAKVAADAINEKIGKSFNVTEVFIDGGEFRVQAQDPDNPKNLDEYKYVAGFVTGPNPVKLNGMNENLEKSSFPFDKINFAAIPEFAREAIEKSGIEGAKIYRMTFQRGFAITDGSAGSLGNARWHIEIKGTREDVTAAANPDGKLLGVDLSRTSKAADYKVITTEELQKAQDALKNFLGENARVSDIVIYEKYLMCKTANRENPSVEDTYQYGINGLTKQGLVQMPKINTQLNEDFTLGDINLTDAAKYIEKAKRRVEMPDATISSMSVRRTVKSVMDRVFYTEWSVNLKKGVNEGSVYYDNDGKEIRVRKNGKIIFDEN